MKNIAPNTYWLIDGSSFLFRAFYALPPLNNSQGQPTGAILGVCNMLKRLLEEHNPNHIAVIFDPKGDTERHQLFPEYKANRRETPQELIDQIQPLFAIIRAMGLPLVQMEGQEADDVIATLAKRAVKEGHPVIICTSDKDLAQLVSPHITLLNTMSHHYMDRKGVIEKFGLPPEQIIDFLALTGDSVDNIPGIPGVGPKTAVKWLSTYGSIDKLLEQKESIKGKIGEKLRAHAEHLPLYQDLVTLNEALTLPIAWEELIRKDEDKATLLELITPLEFRRWIETLSTQNAFKLTPPNVKPDPKPAPPKREPLFNTKVVNDQSALDALIVELKEAKVVALDLETTSLNTLDAKLVGIALALDGDTGYYLPLLHKDTSVPWDAATLLSQLDFLFNNADKRLLGHNLKFDLRVLLSYNTVVSTPLIDTMLMSYVAKSHRRGHDLDSLAQSCLEMTTQSFDALMEAHEASNMQDIPTHDAAVYAAEDVVVAWRLWQYFLEKQADFQAYLPILETMEWPLVPILAAMEHHGVLIDEQTLAAQSAALSQTLATCQEEAFSLVGHDFNLASPKQLREILYTDLNLPVLKKTPKGDPSTSEEALEKLLDHHPLPEWILQHRHMSKLKNTYTDRLPEEIHPHTQRVHCSYNQAITSTGRLSSNHPNLQNIPIKTAEGRAIRQAFIAPNDQILLCADYSQIELRIMAHWSKEPALIQAFLHDHDIHAATASELFSSPIEAITSEQRRFAKTINFGLLYGMSAWGLGKQLNIGRKEAEHYIEQYFERYPKVLDYMNTIKQTAHAQGYIETLFGRRIYLEDISHRQKMRQMGAERAAINGPMQGTAADIIKHAMIACQKALHDLPVTMIMQVHDELIFEVAANQVTMIEPIIEKAMIEVVELAVPLKVNIGHGKNWDVAH